MYMRMALNANCTHVCERLFPYAHARKNAMPVCCFRWVRPQVATPKLTCKPLREQATRGISPARVPQGL